MSNGLGLLINLIPLHFSFPLVAPRAIGGWDPPHGKNL
jgi:hypothetical protein